MIKKVFVSYCKEDSGWLDKIKKFIVPKGLAESEGLDLWDDSRIPPGSEWNDEIHHAITQSQCSLLLVSQDFLNSEFIWKHEVPKLVELRAAGHIILWIPLRPATISKTRLSELQALSSPDVPLSRMTEADQEAALVTIADTFEKIAGQSLGGNPGGQIAPAGQTITASQSSPIVNQKRIARDMLHTLIDREPQESPFLAAAKDKTPAAGANILLLPYSKQDCLDLLMSRIEDYTFPVHINRAAQLRNIPWPRNAPSSADGLKSYVYNVLSSESIDVSPDDAGTGNAGEQLAIEEFRKKIERRALVFWSDTQKDAPDAEQCKLLGACIDWWRAFGHTDTINPLVLFTFRHKAPGAIALSALKDHCGWYEAIIALLKGPRLIDPLQPITLDDIEAWFNLDPIRRSYNMARVRTAATALFATSDALPMTRIDEEFRGNWLNLIADKSL